MALNLKSRKISGIQSISPLLIIGFLGIPLIIGNGCQHRPASDSETKFGYDDDLPDVVLPPPPLQPVITNKFDQNFCKGVTPGKCFSLVLHIPLPKLVNDLGLSILALASESKTMSLRIHEACQAGWADFKETYRTNSTYKQRNRLVNQVEKMRCLLIFDDQPSVGENLRLADNEVGLSLWLTKFGISGHSFEGNLGSVSLKVQNSSVYMNFRNISIYSGSLVNPNKKGWHPIEGLGIAPIEVKKNLDKDIVWKVDFKQMLDHVGEFVTDPGRVLSVTKSFADQAQSTFDSFKTATNPLGAAGMVLVGVGYNALQALCSDNPSSCSKTSLETDDTKQLRKDLKPSRAPSAETTELFRLAVARSIQGALDQVIVLTPPQQLFDKFFFSSDLPEPNP